MTEHSARATRWLTPAPLTRAAFQPFGDVLEAGGDSLVINQGTSLKFPDLCQVELDSGARVTMHLYRPDPISLPFPLRVIERHPLASQAFIPLGKAFFVVVVCGYATPPRPNELQAFVTNGQQGIQLRTGVWHHPLVTLEAADFLIVDRFCANQRESESNLEMVDVASWNAGVQGESPLG